MFLLWAFISKKESHKEACLCISPETNKQADRSYLQIGSPYLVSHHWSNAQAVLQTMPSASSSCHSCSKCWGRHQQWDVCYWLYFLFISTTHHFSALFCPWGNGFCCVIGGFTGTYPKVWGWQHTTAVVSNSWQNSYWGSSWTPSCELELPSAVYSFQTINCFPRIHAKQPVKSMRHCF